MMKLAGAAIGRIRTQEPARELLRGADAVV